MGPILGRYIDRVSDTYNKDISLALYNIAGVQFSMLAVIILGATLIPRGALRINPKEIEGQSLTGDGEAEVEIEFEDYLKSELDLGKETGTYTAYVEAEMDQSKRYGHRR